MHSKHRVQRQLPPTIFPVRCSPPRAKYCMLCRLNEDQVTGIAANVERVFNTAFLTLCVSPGSVYLPDIRPS